MEIAENLTVVITNYNYGVYIPQCIASVLANTIQPKHIVVVDDASVDNSRDILRNYESVAEVVLNEKNLGIAESYNKVMSKVQTEWVFFLDADNLISSDYIKDFVLAQKNSDAAIFYTDIFLFGELAQDFAIEVGAKKYFNWQLNEDAFEWVFPNVAYEKQKTMIMGENFIHGNSFFRKAAFDNVGGFDGLKPEDHELWKKIIANGYYAQKLKNAKLGYRKHSKTQAQEIVVLQAKISDLYLIIFDLEEKLHNATHRVNKRISSKNYFWGRVIKAFLLKILIPVLPRKYFFKLIDVTNKTKSYFSKRFLLSIFNVMPFKYLKKHISIELKNRIKRRLHLY